MGAVLAAEALQTQTSQPGRRFFLLAFFARAKKVK